MAVDAKVFLSEAETIAAEEPGYRKGHYGQDGLCDCIGLIIGAIRRAGGQWRGLHGSNYAAREEMQSLEKIYGTGGLKPGELVYKTYEPGQKGYDLPERYKAGGAYYNGDLRDYYHVGIVISVYPLRIRHMTSPMPKMDTAIGKWSYHGWLKKLSSATEERRAMDKAIIAGGDTSAPIRMRKAGSTGASVIAEIPQGSEVEILEGGGAWNRVLWNGKEGYVMSKFITAVGASTGNMIQVPEKELEQIYDKIGDWLGRRG